MPKMKPFDSLVLDTRAAESQLRDLQRDVDYDTKDFTIDYIIQEFQKGLFYIPVYLRFLSLLDQEGTTLSALHGNSRRTKRIDDRVLKILKANFFLLLYNLVEASIRDGFRALYEAMEAERCTVRVLRPELRQLWIDAAVDRLKPQTSNQDSYRNLARRLVQEAVDDVAAKLRVDDLRFGGNLDGDRIRRTCSEHGVSVRTHPRAKGGEKLNLVKLRRNDLAHGGLSFSECGRDYTLAQLVEMRQETVLFVRNILTNVERHSKRKAFRSQ